MPAQPSSLRAPEFGQRSWLNTRRALTLEELRGRIVLLNFWTYSSVDCCAVLDGLGDLQRKHRDHLLVIGVHCARYPAQRSDRNLARAVLRHRIRYPVINDFDFELWRRYSIRDWPTFVLIDAEGNMGACFSGREAFQILSRQISRLITDMSAVSKTDLPLLPKRDRARVLCFPTQVLIDPQGERLFISDTGRHRILICDLSGRVTDVIGRAKPSRSDGTFERAGFRYPHGLALDGDHLYVADTWNHLLRRCNLVKRIVSTVAGTGEQRSPDAVAAPPGRPLQTRLSAPYGLLCLEKSLFVTMAGAHQIWLFDLVTQELGAYAGVGFPGRIDGTSAEAAFAKPTGIASDGASLYVADSEGNSVRSLSIEPLPTIATVLGIDPFEPGDSDGPASEALLQYPCGLAVGREGFYIADSYNNKIKRLVRRDGLFHCETFVGGPSQARDAVSLQEPNGLALADGKLYIADMNSHAIRVADLVSGQIETLDIR